MISILLNSLGRGGAERSVLLLLDALIRKGIGAELVLLRDADAQYEIPPGLTDHVVFLKGRGYVQSAHRALAHVRRRRPDVIYAMMPQASLIAVVIGALTGVRVVTSERTTPALFYANPVKRTLALVPHAVASRVVFISEYALANGLPRSVLGRRIRDRAVVLHNPVPVEITPEEAAHDRRLRAERILLALASPQALPLRLLLATRLVEGKGIMEFLQEVGPWLQQANAQLTIAGAGPLEPNVRALALSLGLREKIRMMGFIDNMAEAYRTADAVVLPSRSEGFGRVGFEAYQHGCFVVGRPENCFFDEVASDAIAWAAVGSFAETPAELETLSKANTQFDHDIRTMRHALAQSTHAEHFLTAVRKDRT